MEGESELTIWYLNWGFGRVVSTKRVKEEKKRLEKGTHLSEVVNMILTNKINN